MEVLPQVEDIPIPPAILRALYQAEADLIEMNISAVDYYEYLQVSTVEFYAMYPIN